MADEFCPSCHSKTADNPLTVRVQGGQSPSETDSDIGSGERPLPRWSEDPVLTRLGFNGSRFRGATRLTKRIIQELQDVRKQQEDDLGFTSGQKTGFSELISGTGQVASRRHITELRESTEKILNSLGITLSEYFRLNDRGEVDTSFTTKTDWTDVRRGDAYLDNNGNAKSSFVLPDSSVEASPTFPRRTPIGASHIEDLRRQIALLLFKETWTPHEEETLTGANPQPPIPPPVGDMTTKGPGLWTVPFLGIISPFTSEPSGTCGELSGAPTTFITRNESKELEWENAQEPDEAESVPKKVHTRYSYFHHEDNNSCPSLNDPDNPSLTWTIGTNLSRPLNIFYTYNNNNSLTVRRKHKLTANSRIKGKITINLVSQTVDFGGDTLNVITTPDFNIGQQNDAGNNEVNWAFFYQIGLAPVDSLLTIHTDPPSPVDITFMRYFFRGAGEHILDQNILDDFQTLITSLGSSQQITDFYDGTVSTEGLFLSSVALGVIASTNMRPTVGMVDVPSWEFQRSVEGIFDPPTVVTK